MNKEKEYILEGLQSLMCSGCTCSELVCFVEACLSNNVKPLTLIEMISDAFDIHAGYFQAVRDQKHPLDVSILNATILPKIVANRKEWQSHEIQDKCWMDKIYVEPPATLLESTSDQNEKIPPLGISTASWNALSESDRSEILNVVRINDLLSYRSALLAVLCEQLQLQVRVSKNKE